MSLLAIAKAKRTISLALTLMASTATAPASAATYRFRLIDNLVFVPVSVNGRAGWGVVDSGTTGIAIDSSFAQRNGIRQGQALGQADVSGPAAPIMHAARVSSLAAVGGEVDARSAFLIDTSAYTRSAGFPVDVILGEPFFRRRTIVIDYPHRTIEVQPSRKALPSCADLIDFSLLDGVPVISASARFADGQMSPLRLMVDLGTRDHAVLLGGRFLDTPEGRALRLTPAKRIGTGAGGDFTGWTSRMTSLRIGDHVFPSVPYAATSQASSGVASFYDGTLGTPLWRRGKVTLDYEHHAFCLEDG